MWHHFLSCNSTVWCQTKFVWVNKRQNKTGKKNALPRDLKFPRWEKHIDRNNTRLGVSWSYRNQARVRMVRLVLVQRKLKTRFPWKRVFRFCTKPTYLAFESPIANMCVLLLLNSAWFRYCQETPPNECFCNQLCSSVSLDKAKLTTICLECIRHCHGCAGPLVTSHGVRPLLLFGPEEAETPILSPFLLYCIFDHFLSKTVHQHILLSSYIYDYYQLEDTPLQWQVLINTNIIKKWCTTIC